MIEVAVSFVAAASVSRDGVSDRFHNGSPTTQSSATKIAQCVRLCLFLIKLEMTTSRDDGSVRVTRKHLKERLRTDTQQKRSTYHVCFYVGVCKCLYMYENVYEYEYVFYNVKCKIVKMLHCKNVKNVKNVQMHTCTNI